MTRLSTVMLLLCAGASAHAYDQRVHVFLSQRFYGGATTKLPQAGAGADALRREIWRIVNATDEQTRTRFLARYPTLEKFDAWEWKRFALLNPEKKIAGFDEDVALPAGEDPRQVYATASRLPDDDKRNQERFRHDARRNRMMDGSDPIPEDPATLDMGGLTGLSSQAHAHYGLPPLSFSDDPEVLKKEPRRFAVPPTVRTFGVDFAHTYTILALVSARLPDGERLALTHAGAAAHHIEDVANQIHTVQVGIFDFFKDAKIESIKEELRSFGGLTRSRQTFLQIGIDIITNHHVLAETLFAKHLLNPADPVARSLDRALESKEIRATLARVEGCVPEDGRIATQQLIEESSHEGAEVYRLIRDLAGARWSRAGAHFHEEEDPDAAIRSGADAKPFFQIELKGVVRLASALGIWWKNFEGCRAAPGKTIEEAAQRWITAQLDLLDAVEKRQASYVRKPAEVQQVSLWVPMLYLFVFAISVIVFLVVRRRRRSRR